MMALNSVHSSLMPVSVVSQQHSTIFLRHLIAKDTYETRSDDFGVGVIVMVVVMVMAVIVMGW